MGYVPAGMRFNSVSTRHTSDTFHVCYEVMSVNTVELRCTMRNGDQRNTGKIGGLWVSGGAEWSGNSRMEWNREIGEKQRKNSDISAVPPMR